MKEKEKMDFKKRYILNRLVDVLEEVNLPGYVYLECLAIMTAGVMRATAIKGVTLEEFYEHVDLLASIAKEKIKEMSEKEDEK